MIITPEAFMTSGKKISHGEKEVTNLLFIVNSTYLFNYF